MVTVGVAMLQAMGAAWRDAGIVTMCAVGATLVLTRGDPSVLAASLLVGALAIAAAGWMRGGRQGVGRPGLDGLGFTVAAACGLMPFVVRDLVPPGVREWYIAVALVALGITAATGLVLALERPGPRRRRPRFFRRVQVIDREQERAGRA